MKKASEITSYSYPSKIENPNCLQLFGSIEFLQGMTALDTREGSANDSKYLHLVANAMGAILNGGLMGDKVTSLKLNIYAKFSGGTVRSLWESNIVEVARLISECRNLETLDLRFAGTSGLNHQEQPVPLSPILIHFIEGRCGLLDNNGPFQTCTSCLEQVKKFSFVASIVGGFGYLPLLKIGSQPIQFKRLTMLRLVIGIVDATSWGVFLNSFRETLTTLHLREFRSTDEAGLVYSPLPFPLPHLKEVSIMDYVDYPIGEVLSQCPKLEHVDLLSHPTDESVMESLINLPAVRKVEVELYLPLDDDLVDHSKFKVVNWFKEKITIFDLNCYSFYRQYTAALDHAIDTCQNLTEFGFSASLLGDEMWAAKASLSKLFQNQERAMQLCKLWLGGEIPQEVLKAVFENCLGLEHLEISRCVTLNDGHLIEWASRGAKPIKLLFSGCDGITDQGIIPVLKNSASRLKRFRCYSKRGSSKVTEMTWKTCFEYCRYARDIEGYSALMADVRALKCFYKSHGFGYD